MIRVRESLVRLFLLASLLALLALGSFHITSRASVAGAGATAAIACTGGSQGGCGGG
jgi:hypothetical protein